MAEQKTNMTDEQLAQELRKSKGGKLGGKILSLLGGVIAVAGMILGGNLVLVVIGGVVLGLGQMVQGKSKGTRSRLKASVWTDCPAPTTVSPSRAAPPITPRMPCS